MPARRTFEIDDWPRGADSALPILDRLKEEFQTFRATVFAIPAEMTDGHWRELERRSWLRTGIHGFSHRKGECRRRSFDELDRRLDAVLADQRWRPVFKAPWYGYHRPMFEVLRNRGIPACTIGLKGIGLPVPEGLMVWNAVQAGLRGIECVRAHVDARQGPAGRRTAISRLLRRGLTGDWGRRDTWEWIEDLVRPALLKLNLGSGPQVWEGWDCLDWNTKHSSRTIPWQWGQPLPCGPCTADVILISHSLMYCAAERWPEVLLDCWRVLQPGGVLRISEDDTRRRVWRPAGTVHRTGVIRSEPDPESVGKVLSDVGFEVHPAVPGSTLSPHQDVLRGDSRHRLWRRGQKFYLEGIKAIEIPDLDRIDSRHGATDSDRRPQPDRSRPADERRWIDVVTLAVPRPTVTQSIESLLDRIDRRVYRLRWIIHLDWLDCLQNEHEDCLRRIDGLAGRFDDSRILTAAENQGHAGSFFRALEHVRHDCLYWEDDKVCVRPFSLGQLIADGGDQISLQGRSAAGTTSASFWRLRLVQAVQSHPARGRAGRCLETWLKAFCVERGFRAGSARDVAVDVGLKSLTDRRLIRQRRHRGAPVYAAPPGDLTYVTWINDATAPVFLSSLKEWSWCLCLEAFPLTIFGSEHLRDSVPSTAGFHACDLPDESDHRPGFPGTDWLRRVAQISTEFVGWFHPCVRPRKRLNWLDYDEIRQYDLYGHESLAEFVQFQRTDLLRRFLAAGDRGSGQDICGEQIWRFATATGARIARRDLQQAGFLCDAARRFDNPRASAIEGRDAVFSADECGTAGGRERVSGTAADRQH